MDFDLKSPTRDIEYIESLFVRGCSCGPRFDSEVRSCLISCNNIRDDLGDYSQTMRGDFRRSDLLCHMYCHGYDSHIRILDLNYCSKGYGAVILPVMIL